MTSHHAEPVVCECGHKGVVHWSENDAPFPRPTSSRRRRAASSQTVRSFGRRWI